MFRFQANWVRMIATVMALALFTHTSAIAQPAVRPVAVADGQVSAASPGQETDDRERAEEQERKAALAKLEKSHPDELVEFRTSKSRVIKTERGHRVELFTRPVHVEVEKGVFEQIDTSVVPTASAKDEYQFSTRANAWTARFTDKPGANKVRVEAQGRWFTFELDEETGKGKDGYRATANGSAVTYGRPNDPVKIKYEVQETQLKESIILERFTGKSAWDFALKTSGLVPQVRPDGRIGLAKAESVTHEVWVMDRVFAVDAAGARVDGTLELKRQPDGSHVVTVAVDPAWLQAPERQYPVEIDPTVFHPDDAWAVLDVSKEDPYYGTHLILSGSTYVRTALRFDLNTLPHDLLSGHQLKAAVMLLRFDTELSICTTFTGNEEGLCWGTLDAHVLAQEWYRGAATWTRPRWEGTSWDGGDPCSTTKCPGLPPEAILSQAEIRTHSSYGGNREINVSLPVKAWMDKKFPNYGFLLTLRQRSGSYSTSYFKTGGLSGPKLYLEFEKDSTPPAVYMFAPAEGATLPGASAEVGVVVDELMDNGAAGKLDRIELFVDNVRVETRRTEPSGTYRFALDPAKFVAGKHQLFARAFDRAGNWTDSQIVNVTIQGGLITAPDNLRVAPTSPTAYKLSWGAAQAARPAPGQSGAAVTYNVQRSDSSSFTTGVTTLATGLTATEYTDTAGSAGYYYRVQAVSQIDGAVSLWSAAAGAKPPLSPDGVVASSKANGNVRLTWQHSPSAHSQEGISYRIYRTTAGIRTRVASDLNGTSWTDNTVSSGAHTYEAVAVDADGREGAAAPPVTLTTQNSTTALEEPEGVRAIPDRQNRITLIWDEVPGLTYHVYRSTDQSNWSRIAANVAGWFYTDADLTEGATYYYQVQAVSGQQAGLRSQTVGAMAVGSPRLGIDSRWTMVPVSAIGGTAYANVHNGNLSLMATDSVVPAPYLPVVIRRHYNAQGMDGGSLGGWRLSTEWTVEDFGAYAVLTLGDGGEQLFTHLGNGRYRAPRMVNWTLSREPDGRFTLDRPDRITYRFNAAGRIASIAERNGNRILYQYDAANRLQTITDPVGRITALAYDSRGRVARITDGANRQTHYEYDGVGRLARVVDPEGTYTVYRYDSEGRLVWASDASGRWNGWSYDTFSRAAAVYDGLGNRTWFAYTSDGNGGGTTRLVDSLGARTTFTYNGDGLLTSLTDAEQNAQASPLRRTIQYQFDSADPSRLSRMTLIAPNGLRTDLTYDALGNVTEVVETGTDLTAPGVTERRQRFTYMPGSSDLAEATDPEGNITASLYSTAEPVRLQSVQDAVGGVLSYTYSSSPAQPGWITAVTDPRGGRTTYTYDAKGNVAAIGRVLSPTKTLIQSMTYYEDGSLKEISDLRDAATPSSPVTRMEYDQLGRRTRTIYPDGSAEAWIYHPGGQLALAVGRGGQWSAYAYDPAGRLVRITDNAGTTVSYQYDAAGNATVITDARGHSSSFAYDRLHRLVRERRADGMTTLRTYDVDGNVIAVTSGHESIIGTKGYTVTASYYQTGLVREVREPLPASAVLLENDSAPIGQVVENVQRFEYNRAGKVVRETDGNGVTTAFTYDSLYRLRQVIDGLGGVTEYEYDLNGNRTKIWDAARPKAANGPYTEYFYDAMNRVVGSRDPLGRLTSLTYDDAGRLSARSEPKDGGQVTVSYQYDLGHRVSRITYANRSGFGPFRPIEYLYDGAGRRLFRRDDTGLATYDYDQRGLLTRAVSGQEDTRYEYDPAGNMVGVTYSIGRVAYAYDQANRMTTVTDPIGNVTTYTYDEWDHVKEVALPLGVKRSYTYHTLPSGAATNRIDRIDNRNRTYYSNPFWAGSYKYDLVGNVRKIDAEWATYGLWEDSFHQTYTLTARYDALYRLTEWNDTSNSDPVQQSTYFAYDAVGNRTRWGNQKVNGKIMHLISQGSDPVEQTATYDATNQMTEQVRWMPDRIDRYALAKGTITYDASGNTRAESFVDTGTGWNHGSYQYKYDDANRLVRYINDSLNRVDEYYYDGDGRRTLRRVMDAPWADEYTNQYQPFTRYEYIGNEIAAEHPEDGKAPVWYIFGRNGEKLYSVYPYYKWRVMGVFIKDHLDSVRQVIRDGRETANYYHYDAFGVVTRKSVSLSNSYHFASAPLDSLNSYASLYNLKARLYNPQVGRFLTQDTYKGSVWEPWTQHLYVYVHNNPVNYVDPSGHMAMAARDCLFSGCGGGSATGTMGTTTTASPSSPTATWNGTVPTHAIHADATMSGTVSTVPPGGYIAPGMLVGDGASVQNDNGIVNRLTSDWERAAKKLGIDRKLASKAIHAAKGATGRGGADNIQVDDKTGDIIAPETGEVIGHLADYDNSWWDKQNDSED